MSMMNRVSFERRRSRVTDEDVQRWVEAEDERFNRIDMEQMEADMNATTSVVRCSAVGSVPSVSRKGYLEACQYSSTTCRQPK
jgi:hypothetical protein